MTTREHIPAAQWRHRVVLVGIGLVGIGLACRALYIQVIDNDFLQDQGEARYLRTIEISAHRGAILDRNGEILAASSPVASVWVDPVTITKDNVTLVELAKLIDRPVPDIRKAIATAPAGKRLLYLKKHMEPARGQAIKVLIKDSKLAGIGVRREYRRFYPAGEVTAHVLGLTNIDGVGTEGIEKAHEASLLGRPGKETLIKDLHGRYVDDVEQISSPQPGKDLTLSIDRRLQYLAYRELKRAVQDHGAKAGSLVLLDARSGEVLAMVNQPSYNPNNRADLTNEQLRNRAVTDMFEPGSTVKPFTIAAGLANGKFRPDTRIETGNGRIKVGNRTITDHEALGRIDVRQVLQKSSNVGTVLIARGLPHEQVWQLFHDVGLGSSTNSSFPGETRGKLPPLNGLSQVDYEAMSYGYGLGVSTLQLAQAYTVFANEGMLKPISFSRVDEAPVGKRVMSAEVVRTMLPMLEGVVSAKGTAVKASVPGYRVGGKTGTARKFSPTGGYASDSHVSLFAGLAPLGDPRLVAVIMIDEPSGTEYFGGQIAAPVFSRVMASALRVLNIAPDAVSVPPLRVAVTP